MLFTKSLMEDTQMKISDAILPEFDQEMASTRKTLERVPEDKFDWQPHQKSMTLKRLAIHLAEMPSWAVHTIEKDSIDLSPPDGQPHQQPTADSRDEILAMFDKNIADARAAIASVSDEELMKSWSLLHGGNTILTMPKIAVIRTWVMNHNIHHRAQLGVYLRLNDVPVPAIYGPSADEGGM
ncbi:MAG: hypothetical protein NVSMB56_18170 [Pyrinomonadaceae bacterium]